MGQELLIVTPDRQTRRVSFTDEQMSLGRAHSNQLCYPEDASLSRRHLLIGNDAEGVWAEDLGSKNGTYLNDLQLERETETHLKDDDLIRIGETLLLFTTKNFEGEENAMRFLRQRGQREIQTVYEKAPKNLRNVLQSIDLSDVDHPKRDG